MKNRTLAGLLLAIAAAASPLALHAAEAQGAQEKTKEYVKDSVITTKVKTELAAAKLSSLLKIQVETGNAGRVTLTGTTNTPSARNKAVSLTKAVKGVTSVDNQIKVVADK
ncbi:BON domain-containing protein [Rubrivivax rivuli]|uniref:BON domain-containing protein n=1 Tax=Rubrivivax rivuli TaxID=1862385 RepID=A0A437RRG5_9BURK|nr:BON domain-containing protein [Rubrivivax rivuli]RVU49394.1 BON domain-containing protein [Rubrivivax rivuli]